MSNLNRIFDDSFNSQNGQSTPVSSTPPAASVQPVRRENRRDFQLTGAVRPSKNSDIKPVQGFRNDTYVDEGSGAKVPVIMASVSKEIVFETFMRLIQRLGPVVDVVLESSHSQNTNGHIDLYREHIDMPVLTSVLWDYQDLLTNDGCTGIAVLNPNVPQEIQFEEHKLLICYGSPLEPYEFILDQAGVCENEDIRFITEAEHVHASSAKYVKQFEQLRTDLGLDGTAGQDHREESEGFGEYGDSAGGLL